MPYFTDAVSSAYESVYQSRSAPERSVSDGQVLQEVVLPPGQHYFVRVGL